MKCQNAHDALVEGLFEIGISGVDFVEIQILLALFVHGLGDEAFERDAAVLFVGIVYDLRLVGRAFLDVLHDLDQLHPLLFGGGIPG